MPIGPSHTDTHRGRASWGYILLPLYVCASISNATQPPASVVSLTSSEEVTAFLNEAVSDVNGSQEDNDDRSQDRTYQPSEASGDDTASQGTQVGREMGGVSDGNSTMIRVPRVRVQQGSISGSIFGGMDNSDFQERMAAILQMINELNEATRTMRNQVQRLHDSRNRARTGRETVMAHHILPAILKDFVKRRNDANYRIHGTYHIKGSTASECVHVSPTIR
ncbi:hypothetical protein ONZ45_g19721 [Pleurotus djamor]|nr:hypothetical protein ONZ45_g19721 [Pleurotus djamor]